MDFGIPNERLGESYNRYQKNTYSESNKNNYNMNDYNNAFSSETNAQLSVNQEPDIKYSNIESTLVISSKDRDIINYPNSSNFIIDLNDEYKNIKRIELVQAIIPDKNSVLTEPFLLLNIKELQNTMDSNNKAISDSFAMLQMSPPTVSGSFIICDKRIHENVVKYYKTPLARLSRLTITITNSDGDLFSFGGNGTTSKAYQCQFVLKIITEETSRTMFNSRNVY